MKQMYYYVMEGSQYLLADERHKKHLLDRVLGMQKRRGWPVYAFCVTDDRAYLITQVEDADALWEAAQDTASSFIKDYKGDPAAEKKICLNVAGMRGIGSLAELAVQCRIIHRIPLTLGYVDRICDYWWSSYLTYLHRYQWNAVDCSVLLQYFSGDPEIAIRKLKKYHAEAGRGRRPEQTARQTEPGKTPDAAMNCI